MEHSHTVHKKRLYELLKNRDDDLPYCSNVNEQFVLEALLEIEEHDDIDEELKKWLEQWMVFNRKMNEFESQEYMDWMVGIYRNIRNVLSRAIENKRVATCEWVAHAEFASH
tara:strand:- start:33 stop:368 length:336 start_codon:yes stop_codon:yes gene_type:complete